MNAAIRAKQTSTTRPETIRPADAPGSHKVMCDMTFCASSTPEGNTSLGAIPAPPHRSPLVGSY
jgi:hypothetical protein